MASLKGKDILHGNQFSKRDIDGMIKIASDFEKELKKKKLILKDRMYQMMFEYRKSL